jgi:hypothetical protein
MIAQAPVSPTQEEDVWSVGTAWSRGTTQVPGVSRTAPVVTVNRSQLPQRGQATATEMGTSSTDRWYTTANGRRHRGLWQR